MGDIVWEGLGRDMYTYLWAASGQRQPVVDWAAELGSVKPNPVLLLGRLGPEILTNHRQPHGLIQNQSQSAQSPE